MVGRSNVVGKPVAFLLLRENATVTVCHSRTTDLAPPPARARRSSSSRPAGPGLVTGDMLRRGVVVVDVGINVVDGRLVGDVDFASAERGRLRHHARPRRRRAADQRAAADPPDARGPPTRPRPARPARPHSLTSASRRRPSLPHSRWLVSFPSDLEIARSVTPRPIVEVARDARAARRRDRAVRLDQGQGDPRRRSAASRRENPRGKYVLVTAITPTPLGEGKIDHHGRARPGPRTGSAIAPRSPSASRRSARSSASRAAPPAAATARSSRWRTSTST